MTIFSHSKVFSKFPGRKWPEKNFVLEMTSLDVLMYETTIYFASAVLESIFFEFLHFLFFNFGASFGILNSKITNYFLWCDFEYHYIKGKQTKYFFFVKNELRGFRRYFLNSYKCSYSIPTEMAFFTPNRDLDPKILALLIKFSKEYHFRKLICF